MALQNMLLYSVNSNCIDLFVTDQKLRRAGVLSRFTRDPTALSNVLKYHVVADDLSRDDLKSQTSCQVETLDNKNKLRINKYSSVS